MFYLLHIPQKLVCCHYWSFMLHNHLQSFQTLFNLPWVCNQSLHFWGCMFLVMKFIHLYLSILFWPLFSNGIVSLFQFVLKWSLLWYLKAMKPGFIGFMYEATEIRVFATECLFFCKHCYQIFRKCLENLNNHLFFVLRKRFCSDIWMVNTS